ncbi:MAG: penicillin-binding transpeptidase domain-containing protein [Ruminococcus flavefaciens]|nr:penicillin-binding transpeptidase domain-containing protein [Ruminococcus flavefaciens]MCM1060496.1 penicillin-binding transpeptidase domain-containing protein [Eubacterium sp.]
MKSIKRCQGIISLFLVFFVVGMIALVIKIQREASFYMMHSDSHELGMVYDRNGDVLFDGSGNGAYEDNYFIDVGNLIGDDKGQMTNTLVAQNLEKLNNYSFSAGLVREGGKAAIYTTLNHKANRAVYNAFGNQDGCAVAYNYKTGEILICTSLPSLDVTKGYENISDFKSGTLISKTLYGTVPGSTQKVSTVIAALEIMGADTLFSKSFSCSGTYMNKGGNNIDCHNAYGHGTQNIQQAVENSCNPFFAQLIEDEDLPLSQVKKVYEKLGYAVNDDEEEYFDIDGIRCQKASTTLNDPYEFKTQWGCIGQGDTLVSPIQLMMWQSAIANESGEMTIPHLIDHTTDVYGKINDDAKTQFSDRLFSDDTAETVKQILLTNGENHYANLITGYKLGVKSGTAQVNEGNTENSLLVGFVDDPDFPVAFCILIEDKNSTSLKTENIAQVMLDALSRD